MIRSHITFNLLNISLKFDFAPKSYSFHFMFKFSYVMMIKFCFNVCFTNFMFFFFFFRFFKKYTCFFIFHLNLHIYSKIYIFMIFKAMIVPKSKVCS